MEDLRGKKLLLLGGINHSIEIINAAHEMGVLVYVTDYNENTPAKAIADKAFSVSTTDVDAVTALCRSENIDGVITGFIDSMLPYCAEICSRLGLPFWATPEQLQICSIKDNFKQACRKFGVSVIKDYSITDAHGNLDCSSLTPADFPILIKPSDYSGSKGVFVCRTPKEVAERFPESRALSKNGRVIAEQYIQAQHVNMYYTLSDGDIVLSAMADRYVDYLDGKAVPVLLVHPSKYLADYERTVDPKVKAMFSALGMRDGLAFVQGFRLDDGSFVVYEMGYRLNGGGTYVLIDACQDFDQMKSLIHFSLTGEMGDRDILLRTTPHFEGLAANCVVSVDSTSWGGGLECVHGLEEARKIPGVHRIIQVRFPGETLSGPAYSHICAYVLFTARDYHELHTTVHKIRNTIKFYVKEKDDDKPP